MKQLHIRCGSDIGDRLGEAGFEGDFLEWADPVCQGPVPDEPDHEIFLETRAGFISRAWGYNYVESFTKLDLQYRALENLPDYDRITLWFEHDAYDQTVLCNLLNRLRGRPSVLNRLYLISTDRFEGMDRFIGFGQLSPAQLAFFRGREIPVTRSMAEHATQFWDAYRQRDPLGLERLCRQSPSQELPYLNGAMMRLLQECPSTFNGLGLTAMICLQALAGEAETPGQIFRDLMLKLDPQPFLGDVMFWPFLRELSQARKPAVTAFDGVREPMALTDYGRALLAGEADWVQDNGIDRWLGGAHLAGRDQIWRWDPERGELQPPHSTKVTSL